MAAIAAINLAQQQAMSVDQLRKHIRAFAITEVVLGGLCTILGIIVFALKDSTPSADYSTIGEGVWGGIGIVIAGSFGIPAAKENAKTAIINCHLALSIIASILSWVSFFVTITFTILAEGGYRVIFGLICALSLTAAIMLSMSSGYCCRLTGTCVATPGLYSTQQPVFIQTGAPVQGSNQGYPPVAQGQYPLNPTPQSPPQYQTNK